MIQNTKYKIIFFFVCIITSPLLLAQDADNSLFNNTLKIYIDCEQCDMDYIKTEIPYVNYVIERRDADIFIMIAEQKTAGEGIEFTVIFKGQNLFSGMCDTLKYNALSSDSDDEIRQRLVRKLKIGLIRYLAKTDLADRFLITLPQEKVHLKPYDPWHNWVFTIELYTYLQGQQKYNFNTVNANISINKVTENWKILNSVSYYYKYNIYKFDDTTITNESKSYSGLIEPVIGINNHLSLAGYCSFYSSTYENIYLSSGIAPALEYDLFPYNESSTRKLTFQYDIGYIYFEYYELTIYEKLKERLFKESASINTFVRQPWGSLNISLEGSHYFHDPAKNRVTLYTDISLPVFKRLSFKIFSYAAMIHDQLSLPKRKLTEEEIILQKKILSTQYSYYVSIGISYTFGSIYSNIVNPRFGN